jgi:anti-sigma B factor antagonist
MLDVKISDKKHFKRIELHGILNAETTPKLDSVINKISVNNSPNILMDLENLSFISSAGIGIFIGSIGKIRDKKGDLRFCNVSKEVKRVFELLEMDDFFIFYESFDEALDNFFF